jgi:hypothetical protein
MRKLAKKPWDPQTVDWVSVLILLVAVLLLWGSFIWPYIKQAAAASVGEQSNELLKAEDYH